MNPLAAAGINLPRVLTTSTAFLSSPSSAILRVGAMTCAMNSSRGTALGSLPEGFVESELRVATLGILDGSTFDGSDLMDYSR